MKKILTIVMSLFVIICISSCSMGNNSENNTDKVQEYLAKGDYASALNIADEEKKNDILKENIIAYFCKDIPDTLKDPLSFVLLDAGYDYINKRIVIYVQGANSYGEKVSSYWTYKYDKDEGKYMYSVFNTLEEEETESKPLIEVIKIGTNNKIKREIKEIIKNDDYKLSKKSVKNINDLFEEAILYDVALLEENEPHISG